MSTPFKEYPLEERIGHSDLFVGREKEMAYFQKWLGMIPRKGSKSHAILARKKSGKTAIVQRIFNDLWLKNEEIIPFYYEIRDQKTWFPNFAVDYYRNFASQYISFLERDPTLIKNPLSLENIRKYGKQKSILPFVQDVNELEKGRKEGNHDLMWITAYSAPHRFAGVYERRSVVMLDEFQNINEYIYRDEACKEARDETLAGGYHEVSESKIAPMLVTGSYVGWLVNVINKYLEAGRLKFYELSPYLEKQEGLKAVYKYADFYHEPIDNNTTPFINQLCFSDPFFISCVIQSAYPEKNLTTEEGISNTVGYEVSHRKAELARTWADYINNSVDRINDRYAKDILLFLTQHGGKEYTHLELKDELQIDLHPNKILERLLELVQADLIEEGESDIAFKGLKDGTLELILRKRFEEEIKSHKVDFPKEFMEEIQKVKKENQSLRGHLSQFVGKMAEDLLATDLRSRKRFLPSACFSGLEEQPKLNLVDVRSRIYIQRDDGKNLEIDIKADSDCGHTMLIEVKKWKTRIGLEVVEDFWGKVQVYSSQHTKRKAIPAILSLGGFQKEAEAFCQDHKIGMATEIKYVKTDW